MSFRQDGVNKNQAGSRTLDLEKKSSEMTTKSTKSCSRKIFSEFFSRAQDRLSPDFFSRGFRETASTDTDAASRTSPTPRRFTLSRSPPPPPRPRRSQFRVPDAQKELKSEIRDRFSDPFTDPTSTKSEQVSSFCFFSEKETFHLHKDISFVLLRVIPTRFAGKRSLDKPGFESRHWDVFFWHKMPRPLRL